MSEKLTFSENKEQAEIKQIIQIVETKTLLRFKLESIKKLAGGVVSLVLAAETVEGEKLVIKHTKDTRENPQLDKNFTWAEQEGLLATAPETHGIDATILQSLHKSGFCVPEMLAYLEKERITVMPDFREEGFHLGQDLLVNGQITPEMGREVGKTFADLRMFFERQPNLRFVTEELPIQTKERFEEPRLNAYATDTGSFNALRLRFIQQENKKPYKAKTWTDSHLKNIAIKVDPETGKITIMVFDFGRAIPCDPEYVLPNHLAHLILASISGLIDSNLAIEYTKNSIESYSETYKASNPEYKFDEKVFLEYLMAEMLHRSGGRWIDKAIVDNNSSKFKIRFQGFHESFQQINTVPEMYDLLNKRNFLYSAEIAKTVINLSITVIMYQIKSFFSKLWPTKSS